METTTKPVATWTPSGRDNIFGQPNGRLVAAAAIVATTITYDSAVTLYPEYNVRRAFAPHAVSKPSPAGLLARLLDDRDTIGEVCGEITWLREAVETLQAEQAELRDELHTIANTTNLPQDIFSRKIRGEA